MRRYHPMLLVLLATSACEGEQPITHTLCETHRDCRSDEVCIAMSCRAPPAGLPPPVVFEVTPPLASGHIRAQVADASRAEFTFVRELWLPAPVEFSPVQVFDPEARAIGARLTVVGAPRILGRETDAFLLLNPERPGSLELLPGTYAARVLPLEAERFPGIEILAWEVRASLSKERRDFMVAKTYRTLKGQVVLRTAANIKVPEVVVRARSSVRGLPSTTAVTDESGRFSLALPDTPETNFVLSASPPDEDQPAWSYEQAIGVPEQTREVTIELEETTPAVQGSSHVRVLGVSGRGPEPVVGANVTLTASTSVPSRVFRANGVTDARGYLSVHQGDTWSALRLIASRYQVVVEPPSKSPYRSKVLILDLREMSPGNALDKQIELGERTLLQGSVLSSDGSPLSSVAISLESLDAARLIGATSDAEGAFQARVDPGEYLVRIEPPKGVVPLPVAFFRAQVPELGAVVLPPFRLPEASILEGRVLSEVSGMGIAGAAVEAFLEAHGRAISLGRVESNGDGLFRLTLPVITE